ncbi:MAG TPA: TetR family transcriptional regulator C-terminal domain-containing protein [Ktedonobacteraceae bacterium]
MRIDFWNRLVYYMLMKTTNAKQALLAAGKELIWEKGYTATGIQDILHVANIPKGSFYHYFASKDALVLAVVESYFQDFNTHAGHYLDDESLTPLTRLRRHFEAAGQWFESFSSYRGCMLGNLIQELAAHHEVFRGRFRGLLEQWRSSLVHCLRQAQDGGELPVQQSVDQVADFCISGFQGALLVMKVSQSPAPLHAFLTMLFEVVLKG